MAALQGLQWATYYEGFRGDTALDPKTNYLANMREEVSVGVQPLANRVAASGRLGCSLWQVGLQPQCYRYQYRCQARRGVPAAVHSYYKVADEDPTPHVAGFLLGREEHWYYLGSTGWWDGRVRHVVLAAAELASHS